MSIEVEIVVARLDPSRLEPYHCICCGGNFQEEFGAYVSIVFQATEGAGLQATMCPTCVKVGKEKAITSGEIYTAMLNPKDAAFHNVFLDLLRRETTEWPDPLTLESMEGEAKAAIDNYFGVCPVCSKTDGYRNIGKTHWFYCDEHKTKWTAGWNLFSSWREEDEATWQENKEYLADYTEVHKPQVE